MKATAVRLLRSSAMSGVPPLLTSLAPRQNKPSRLMAKRTRGAIRTFELTALIMATIVRDRSTVSPYIPKRCWATTAAASFCPASVGSGTTRRKAMFSSR